MEPLLSEALKQGEKQLEQAKITDASTDAWLLFSHAFHMNRVDYLLNQRQCVNMDQYEKYLRFLEQRCQHIPCQHIIGTQEFMGLEFDVNEHVLIPRQDTECLVEQVMAVAKNQKVLDVCTGSGCIIISLEKLCELKAAVAVDISEQALKVAKGNANKLQANVTFLQSDLFEQVEGKFDVIVSNPPYIRTKEIATLMEEVKDHEPMLALDGKEDGLYFYRKIIDQAPEYLNPNGALFFEIGWDQGEEVSALMEARGFKNVLVKKDLAGLDRIVYGNYL